MTKDEIWRRLELCRQDIEAGDTSWQLELIDLVEDVLTESDALRVENGRLRLALGPVAEGCGHARCHACPWIRGAREALAD